MEIMLKEDIYNDLKIQLRGLYFKAFKVNSYYAFLFESLEILQKAGRIMEKIIYIDDIELIYQPEKVKGKNGMALIF